MSSLPSIIAQNVATVRQRIAEAAARSGRTPENITLVAVTKYVQADVIRHVVAAGCADLGESRPQQLWDRAAALEDLSIRWHMIGHLQRNKARRTLPLVAMLHSADSVELLEMADRFSAEAGRRLPVLLEVNVSGDVSKHGLAPSAIEPLLARLPQCANLEVRGLMCMASLEGDLDDARRDFASLRELRDRLTCQLPPGVSLADLSMGMSGDYEVAIEEGATIVRVGSALFEGAAL
jgi:pyridoxal phosphate enzyme (YggS family)